MIEFIKGNIENIHEKIDENMEAPEGKHKIDRKLYTTE